MVTTREFIYVCCTSNDEGSEEERKRRGNPVLTCPLFPRFAAFIAPIQFTCPLLPYIKNTVYKYYRYEERLRGFGHSQKES